MTAAKDIVEFAISEEEGGKGTLKGVVSRELTPPNARTASEFGLSKATRNIRAVRDRNDRRTEGDQ